MGNVDVSRTENCKNKTSLDSVKVRISVILGHTQKIAKSATLRKFYMIHLLIEEMSFLNWHFPHILCHRVQEDCITWNAFTCPFSLFSVISKDGIVQI